MATQKPLVVDNGTVQQIANADTLLAGVAVEPSTGTALRIGAVAGTTITTFPGPVRLDGDVTTVGGTTFTTDATFEGNVTFGNGPADTVTFAATTTVVSDINFATPVAYKITNLANGVNPNDAVNVSQLAAASTLTVGTTAIASGTANRVLFEGAGNVLQESANLTWDGSAFTVNGVVSVGEGSAPAATAAFGKLWANSAADARPYWVDDTGQSFNLTLDRFNTLTPAASVAIDTSPALPVFNSLALNQNTTFTTSNLGNGRSASVRVVCDGTTRTLSFPGTWTWLGSGPPSSLAANDVGYLSITAYGATDADVVAAWSYENMPAVVTGSGVDNQIAVWSGTDSQDGSASLTFDGTTLGVTGGITQSGGAVSLTGNAASSLTTSAGALTLTSAAAATWSTAAGDLNLTASTNSVVVTGAEAAVDAITLTASNAAGGIDINAGTGGVTIDTTAAFSIDGAAASNVSVTGANLTLSTITSGAVNLTAAGNFQISANGNATTWPTGAGAANTVLTNNGAGALSWAPASSGTPASPANSIQFNNAGAFGGSANLTWNGTTFGVTGGITQSGGAVGLTANAASSFTTSAGALTLTSAAAATWSSTAGNLAISGGAALQLTAAAGNEVVVNDGSANVDFRVESDNNANMLLVDASQDSVSIGTTSNTHTFNIGTGASANFCVASGGRIHTYDGSAPTDGQVLIGDTGLGNFAKATLTAGTGIAITNGAGSISIAASNAGGVQPITTISTTTTLGASNYTVLCSATLTVNLPAAASNTGRIYNIKNIGAAATITIDPNASETIDGATTYTLTTQYESITIQCDGTAWFIL